MSLPAAPLVSSLPRVLVVDDDVDVRQAVSSVLAENGYTVGQAGDGAEGLERFRRDRPAVVIADLEMPRLRGVELLRRVHEIDASVAVVLMTGYATLDLAVEAMKDGAADFLVKPVKVARLLDALTGLALSPSGSPEAAPTEPRVRIWSGAAGPDRGFAGSLVERAGSIVIYAGQVVVEVPEAKLAAVLGDDALSGLAERVGPPGRVLSLAARAVSAALEGSVPAMVAALARVAPERDRVKVASAGVQVWVVGGGRERPWAAAGSGPGLESVDPDPDADAVYPESECALTPGSMVLAATPALVAALGGEERFGGFLARHAVAGVDRLMRSLAACAHRREGSSIGAACLVAIEI